MKVSIDKIKGSIFGGAVGDALGYSVEFQTASEIFEKYGDSGITGYELCNGTALVSDDTQMTLFTAAGLLDAYAVGCVNRGTDSWQKYIWYAYKDWLLTQTTKFEPEDLTEGVWLIRRSELYASRAPGMTCLSALREEVPGSLTKPINDSKGCGGVMRVAPIGLFLPKFYENIAEIDMVGAQAAAITHTHPLGYIPAAALVHIVARCATSDDLLLDIVKEAIDTTCELFKGEKYVQDFRQIMERAVELSGQKTDDLTAIRSLGEGWVAEETLAIAVYCALKYQNDFRKAVTVSVNHDGDSDSTGAVTGNILGAYLGYEAIPEELIVTLELRDIMEKMSADLSVN